LGQTLLLKGPLPIVACVNWFLVALPAKFSTMPPAQSLCVT